MEKFNPLNDFEWSLLAAKENKISVEIFLQKFVRSILALPTTKKVQEDGSGFEPVLFDKIGISMLAAFTFMVVYPRSIPASLYRFKRDA